LPIGVLGLATYLWPRRPNGTNCVDEVTAARHEWYLAEMVSFLNDARRLFGLVPLSRQEAQAELHGDRFFLLRWGGEGEAGGGGRHVRRP